MTTDELLHLIDQETARHRIPGHHHDIPGSPCVATIGSLAGTHATRRSIEEAIQQARLEGVPVITDGGLRVATTAAEAHALYRWLRARLVTQNRTAWAVRSAAMLMERGERAKAQREAAQATLWDEAA